MMKKIIVLLISCSCFALISNAQTDFRFGFQASPSFSWMNTNDININGNGTNLGLKLGVLGEKYFRDNYALTFGLGFGFNQGGTLNYKGTGKVWPETGVAADFETIVSGTDLKYDLQYLEIPLGIKMRTQEFGYFRFFADIPVITMSILTQAKGSITGDYTNPPEGLDIRKATNFLTFAWGAGGGAEYSVGENISIIGGINFQTSFVDITRDKGTEWCADGDFDCATNPQEEDSKGKVNIITVKLGVMF